MTTPINPAFLKAHPVEIPAAIQPKFADHLDTMFGDGDRRWETAGHVEVTRRLGSDGKRIFKKTFLGDYAAWTEREHVILLNLTSRRIKHVQEPEGYSTRKKYFESLDAGPDLKHWLDLPVSCKGEELEHIFQDCAHWFSLARWGILALKGINETACVHLDIKADNICLPCQLGNSNPKTQVLPDWPNLRLIDFAFSIWESTTPLTPQTPMIIGKATANRYQSQQLVNAIEADDITSVLAKASKLDWRCDLYSFGYLLIGILDHLPEQCQAGRGGWNAERLDAAGKLVKKLLDFDADWQKNPERLPNLPHTALIREIDSTLDADDLKHRLTARWEIAHRQNWQSGRAGIDIPITKLAGTIISGGEGENPKPRRGKLLKFGAVGFIILCSLWLINSNEEPEHIPISTSEMDNKPAVKAVEEQRKKELQALEELARQKAERPAQLVEQLLKAQASQFEAIVKQTLPEDANEANQVLSAAHGLLFTSWSGAALDTAVRIQQLERLLWLHDALPEKEKRAQHLRLAAQYAKDSQSIENTNWWKSESGQAAGSKEKSWLKETQMLASAGLLRAEYALGIALLSGKLGAAAPVKSGEWLSRALKNDSDTFESEQATIISAILKRVDVQVLVGNDRQFAQAIIPGLQHQSTRNNPAASWLLANTLACRVTPPRYDDARKILEKLGQASAWRDAASARLKTIDNPQWCNTFSSAAKK